MKTSQTERGKPTRKATGQRSRPQSKSVHQRRSPSEASQQHYVQFLLRFLKTEPLGRFLMALIGVAVIILMDILLASNQYERFLTLVGVEIIITSVLLILYYSLRNRDAHQPSQSHTDRRG